MANLVPKPPDAQSRMGTVMTSGRRPSLLSRRQPSASSSWLWKKEGQEDQARRKARSRRKARRPSQGSPGKIKKEGQEDQGTLKQLEGSL